MKQVFLILIGLSYSMLYANEKFSSLYTNISTDCKYEKEDSIPEGSDAPLTCKGPDGYTVIISYSACMEFMKIESKNGKEVIEFPNQPIGSADKRKFGSKRIGQIFRIKRINSF